MKKYLYDYIKELDNKKNKVDIEELKTKISFFQHERLIHLIVTLFFSLFAIIFTFISLYTKNNYMYIITLILYVFVMFYIIHYYYLENGVQKLYKFFDKLNRK